MGKDTRQDGPLWSQPPTNNAGSMLIRGRVIRVNTTKVSKDITMTFDVAPDTGGICSSGSPGVVKDCLMLQAGFGNLENPTTSPTGLVYIPEEGSRVAIAWDGCGYVIVGCYSGPAVCPAAAALQGKAVSNDRMVIANTGMEKSASQVGSIFLGGEVDWLFGAKPGDAIMGKGIARVKVTSDAVVMGSSPSCVTVMKTNDEKLERCKEIDVRMLGYQKSHRAVMGETTLANLHLARPEAVLAPPAGVITTEVFECTPYPWARKAMLIKQKGHITNGIKDDCRQALLGSISSLDIAAEEASRRFTVERTAVVQPLPLAKIGKIPLMELLFDHYETYDNQIDADGSWFIRAGNKSMTLTPGQRRGVPTMDMNMSYDAILGLFKLSLGAKGVPLGTILINGNSGAVQLIGGASSISLSATGVSIMSATKVSVAAPMIDLTGILKINGLPYAAHTHTCTAPGSPSGPPNG